MPKDWRKLQQQKQKQEPEPEFTSITIRTNIRKRLDYFGDMADSYAEVLTKLMDY
jgi:hypothetical protein